MREIVHLQAGQCGNQIGAKVSNFFLFYKYYILYLFHIILFIIYLFIYIHMFSNLTKQFIIIIMHA